MAFYFYNILTLITFVPYALQKSIFVYILHKYMYFNKSKYCGNPLNCTGNVIKQVAKFISTFMEEIMLDLICREQIIYFCPNYTKMLRKKTAAILAISILSRNIRCTHEVCTQTYSWGASAPLS